MLRTIAAPMSPDLPHPLPIVDSHLDLAENVTRAGRDLTVSVRSIRAQEQRTANQATVSLPELERGGIAIAFATVTAGLQPSAYEVPGASTSSVHAAEAHALSQIDLYERWEQQGRVRIVKSVADLEHHLTLWQDDRKPGLVLLMEDIAAAAGVVVEGIGRLHLDEQAKAVSIPELDPFEPKSVVMGNQVGNLSQEKHVYILGYVSASMCAAPKGIATRINSPTLVGKLFG